jgi:hypothetical protein
VDHVGPDTIRQIQQPFAGPAQIVFRLGHPFQQKVAVVEVEKGDRQGALPLRRRRLPPHDREGDVDAAMGKPAGQFERVVPDAADSVGCHQYPARSAGGTRDSLGSGGHRQR